MTCPLAYLITVTRTDGVKHHHGAIGAHQMRKLLAYLTATLSPGETLSYTSL